jgi:DNA-binding response OmpR family regulator
MNKSARLLLIEDDPVLGPVTMDLLTLIGHRASLSSSFEEAYQALTAPHEIEVVLLDLQLGSMRGEELIKAVRQTKDSPPVVIFSAMPIADLRRAANELGANVILQKPCSVNEMTQAIDKALG